MLESAAQQLVFGILVGAIYGLAAVGLSLVFGVLKFLNVAHGELLMLGGYATFWIFTLYGVDPFLALPLVMILLLLVGLALYRGLFVHVVKLTEEVKIKNSLLIGFGLSLVLQNVAVRLWTANERGVTTSYSGMALTFLGVRFPIVRLGALAIALLTFIALHLFLQRTYTGKAIRATVEDWEAASLMGIDIQRVYLFSFALGSALGGMAGTLVSVGYSISPGMGLHWTLKALIVVVLGGLGSIVGTFAGGVMLGLAESVIALLIGGIYRDSVGLLLFILVLIFRPQGLFGAREG
jgi:branched-chain amino acid transport system permease protein